MWDQHFLSAYWWALFVIALISASTMVGALDIANCKSIKEMLFQLVFFSQEIDRSIDLVASHWQLRASRAVVIPKRFSSSDYGLSGNSPAYQGTWGP